MGRRATGLRSQSRGTAHAEIVPLDAILPTGGFSVYDFAADVRSLVPTDEEAGAFIANVERRDPNAADLALEIGRWWA